MRRDNRQSAAKRGYDAWWRRYRERVFPQLLLRDGPGCNHCRRPLPLEKRQVHVDHIVPLAKGGTHELQNLQVLCARCHSVKTVKEDGGFGHKQGPQRGASLDGIPNFRRDDQP